MPIVIDVPDTVAQTLHEGYGQDLRRVVVEHLALDGYNSGRLSQFQVQQLLGHDNRWDTEAWLAEHGANWNYTLQDLENDRRTLDRLFGPVKP